MKFFVGVTYGILTAPSGSPRDTSVTVVSSQSLLVQWSSPLAEEQNGIIVSYTIRVVNVLTEEIKLYQREGHHSEYLVESLHPYYEYDVSVAAGTIIQGPFSTPTRVRTREDSEKSLIHNTVCNGFSTFSSKRCSS